MDMATTREMGGDATERRVVGIVENLVGELGTRGERARVAPGDALDRDLGLGSLERVELLVRLEQAFGVRLADAVMVAASTPRDLARAIEEAGPAAPERPPEAGPVVGEGPG
jgi:fatty-acyl-CoA synthase